MPDRATPLTPYGAGVVLQRHFPGAKVERLESLGTVDTFVMAWKFKVSVSITVEAMNFVETVGEGRVVLRESLYRPLMNEVVRNIEELEEAVFQAAANIQGVLATLEAAFEVPSSTPSRNEDP
jgi:hypothetical protein